MRHSMERETEPAAARSETAMKDIKIVKITAGLLVTLVLSVLLSGCGSGFKDIFETETQSRSDHSSDAAVPEQGNEDKTEQAAVASASIDYSAAVSETEDGRIAFSVCIDDYISSFNAAYGQEHRPDYMQPLSGENWSSFPETSLCFGYDAVRFRYSADPTVWPMPTISLYTPEDGSEIYEICLSFDDHGYQDDLWALYQDLCLCTEKMMIPDLTDPGAQALFSQLRAQSDELYFGNHSAYGDPERPALNAVYRISDIGFYCFYGAGKIELCIVPISESAVERLQTEKTALLDWEEPS